METGWRDRRLDWLRPTVSIWHSGLTKADGHANENDDDRADDVVPQKFDPRENKCNREHCHHAGDRPPERSGRRGAFREDRQDEDAEQRSVEQRSVTVDDLDE